MAQRHPRTPPNRIRRRNIRNPPKVPTKRQTKYKKNKAIHDARYDGMEYHPNPDIIYTMSPEW